jgi:hypothetical protein
VTDDYDAIREYVGFSIQVDAIAKEWRLTRAERVAALRCLYDEALLRHPSKAAGRRNLGPVRDRYEQAGIRERA